MKRNIIICICIIILGITMGSISLFQDINDSFLNIFIGIGTNLICNIAPSVIIFTIVAIVLLITKKIKFWDIIGFIIGVIMFYILTFIGVDVVENILGNLVWPIALYYLIAFLSLLITTYIVHTITESLFIKIALVVLIIIGEIINHYIFITYAC